MLDELIEPRDTGYIPSIPDGIAYRYGGVTGIAGEKLSDGTGRYWEPYLPEFEPQSNGFLDTMACVSFSKLNVIETLGNRKYPEAHLNRSDRALAMLSGTTVTGNTVSAVNTAFRRFGAPLEAQWPFPGGEYVTWPIYYQRPPDVAIRAGAKFIEDWNVQYDYSLTVSPERLMEMLQYSPLQVFIRAYGRRDDVTGIYPRIEGRINHAVMLWGYEEGQYWLIFDTYKPAVKKLAWDTIFDDTVVRHSLTKRVMAPQIQENYLYQMVAGPGETDVHGGFGLAIGSVLYVDEVSKLLSSFVVRNNGNIVGKTGTLTKAQWDEIPKRDLKGNMLPNDATNP